MVSNVGTLRQRLSEYDVSMEVIDESSLGATLADAIDGPTVAVSLDQFDVDLPKTVKVDPTPIELRSAVTGITPAEFAVGEYGSLVLAARSSGSELVSLFVDKHVAVMHQADVLTDMPAAYDCLGEKIPETFESAILATGPSATADMGALVKGVHGPREVELIVVEE